MANKTFDQLPAGTLPVDADLFAMEQTISTSPSTNKVTALQVLDYVTAGFSGNYLPITGGTLTGPLFLPPPTLVGEPTANQAVPYNNVQQTSSIAAAFKHYVTAATTANNTNVVYDNGDSGIGATLTSTVNGYLVVDGQEFFFPGLFILVKDQDNSYENGIYTITDSGSPSTPFVLTRRSDFDGSSTGIITEGSLTSVINGLLNAGSFWYYIGDTNPDIGVDPIIFFSPLFLPEQANTGYATLENGTVNVSYGFMQANSGVLLTAQTIIGTPGFLSVPVKLEANGFTINSTSSADNSIVFWEVINTIPSVDAFGQINLINGSATVNTSAISNSSVVILTILNPVNSNGKIIQVSRTSGVSFSITSGYGFDQSLISWAVYNPDSEEENGTVTLSSGNASVSFPALGNGDIVLITVQNGGSGTLGDISVSNKVSGTGFNIISNSAIDNSTIGWVVYHAASETPHGLVTLVAGHGTANNVEVNSDSTILLSSQNPSLTFGNYAVGIIVPITSFIINSNSGVDTSQVGYVILN